MIGFLQYGRSEFGFDKNGDITQTVSYGIIRNFYYDEGQEAIKTHTTCKWLII